MSVDEPASMAVPHDEQCDKALEHYLKISNEATHFSSLVPDAIEFYKKHYVRRGERKIVYTPGTLIDALENGWMYDPWLNPRGGPIFIGNLCYKGVHPALLPESERTTLSVFWVLVKGSPEQIAALEPFVELPVDEEEEPEQGIEPYGLRTMFIAYNALDGAGDPLKPPEGYVIMHKDHIYAKGTVYTLPPGAVTPWRLAETLAKLANIPVDEAHAALIGILKEKEASDG